MKNGKMHNFIIYIFLLVAMVSVAGAGLENSHFANDHLYDTDAMQCFVESELLPEDNVTNIKVVEPGRVLVSTWQMRAVRSNFSYRAALYFLCALAFLSGLFLFSIRERCILYGNRYVSKISYQVDYIEDQDGRKRIS